VICRLWHGWTKPTRADAYEAYLRDELFPRLARELAGYRGFHILRLQRASETEFVTLVWFDTLDAVRAFAGDGYEFAVIGDTARNLLTRHDPRCAHYELRDNG
jgi:antibiotic biosynthesis monooxygenase (ABM) superfamily enzyme